MTNALIPANRSLTVPTLGSRIRSALKSTGNGIRQVASAVASLPRRFDHAVSSAVGIDLAWSSAAITLSAAGTSLGYRSPVRRYAQRHFHDGLGHLKCFDAVNKSIDSVRGLNHRLKGGHTLYWLPSLIREHGVIAVPGYTLHILQDFTTVAGIPLIPGARVAAIGLRQLGVRSTVATGLVTINLAGAIGAVSAGLLAYEVGSIGYEIYRQVQEKRRLS